MDLALRNFDRAVQPRSGMHYIEYVFEKTWHNFPLDIFQGFFCWIKRQEHFGAHTAALKVNFNFELSFKLRCCRAWDVIIDYKFQWLLDELNYQSEFRSATPVVR